MSDRALDDLLSADQIADLRREAGSALGLQAKWAAPVRVESLRPRS